MDASKFKAIQLLLAIDKSVTPDQVLNMNIDSNNIARHKAAYKNCSDWYTQPTLLQTKQCKKKVVDKTLSNKQQLDEQKRFAETVLMVKKT